MGGGEGSEIGGYHARRKSVSQVLFRKGHDLGIRCQCQCQGLILPKAVFDLHVSVSCLFGPKDADHLSDHVHGTNLRNNVSVRFYSGKTPN